MRKSVEELLEHYRDVNYYYNNCMEYHTLIYFVNAIIEDIADYCGGYTCTNSLELADNILKEFKIDEVQADKIP